MSIKPRTEASGVPVFCSFDELKDITELVPNPKNPNIHPDNQVATLAKIIRNQGWRQNITISNLSGFIVKGHGRLEAAKLLQVEKVPVEYQDYENQASEYADLIADNRLAEFAQIDLDLIDDLLLDPVFENFDIELTGYEGPQLVEDQEEDEEHELDEVEIESAAVYVKPGDLYVLGSHRVLCDDCTSAENLARLFKTEKATLLHADPPYGMGKESDGVENDNLYDDKLDAFQMSWWTACRPHVTDKGSAYIWGQAPQLWRLWYKAGLADSERLELRNEIIWDKGTTPGMKSELMTQYAEATERILFFQFGQQFIGNINSYDFPEIWRPLLTYQQEEAKKAGLIFENGKPNKERLKEITGVQMWSHWFTESQFQIIARHHYRKLALACPGCFEKPHREIKTEWEKKGVTFFREGHEEMRSYFDNGHDIMRDVWNFERVWGEDRHGHATPKPVDLMARILKTSAAPGDIVLEPFLGSGSTLVAAEKTGRICYGLELKPEYIETTIKRWEDMTGEKAVKDED